MPPEEAGLVGLHLRGERCLCRLHRHAAPAECQSGYPLVDCGSVLLMGRRQSRVCKRRAVMLAKKKEVGVGGVDRLKAHFSARFWEGREVLESDRIHSQSADQTGQGSSLLAESLGNRRDKDTPPIS